MTRQLSLFDSEPPETRPQTVVPGCVLFPGALEPHMAQLLADLDQILRASPFRHMQTPGGHSMSVAMSNCGPLGWVSDRKGYRYQGLDPLSGQPWPSLPSSFSELANQLAHLAGFSDFHPDACLINRYAVGAKMGLHQDRDEEDFRWPIVSFSLGLSASFQLGGLQRKDPVQKLTLTHGDALVFGGPARLLFHGILPLKEGPAPHLKPSPFEQLLNRTRLNLTFRRARSTDSQE